MSEDTAEQSGVVEEVAGVPAEEVVLPLDPERLVGSLTVTEFRQILGDTVAARKPRKTGTTAKAVAPEGYTMSVAEAAAKLGVGPMPVRALCRAGTFGEDAVVKVGIRWCIRPEAVEAYVAGQADRIAAKVARKAAKAEAAKGEAVPVADIETEGVDLSELDLDLDEGDENEGAETGESDEGEVEIDADAE